MTQLSITDLSPSPPAVAPPSEQTGSEPTRIQPTAGLGRSEPLSPFVAWSAEDRARIPPELLEVIQQRSLLSELLRDAPALVQRLLDPPRLRPTTYACLATIFASEAAFAAAARAHLGWGAAMHSAILTPLGTILAIAAVIGPIYATSLLTAARLPQARLVPILLAAVATGALVLLPIAPITHVAMGFDREWAGPLSVCGAFALCAIAAGARIRALLLELATEVARRSTGQRSTTLSPDDAYRVGILARMAMILLGFSCTLALWAFDAMG